MLNWLYGGLLAAVVALVSGCAMLDRMEKSADGGSEEKKKVAVWEPTAATPGPDSAVATRASADQTPRPKRKPDIVDPKALVGLDKAAISSIFGQPHRITVAQPALVWSWQTEDCEMRLFLYPDVGNQTFRALAYEISAAEERHKAVVVDTCASRLKWAHAEDSR